MPRQNRHTTEFSGVYFVKLVNENKSFFIRYKRHGKSVEERAGRSNEGWNTEKAWHLRTERMSGIKFPAGELQHGSDLNAGLRWTFSKIFENLLECWDLVKPRCQKLTPRCQINENSHRPGARPNQPDPSFPPPYGLGDRAHVPHPGMSPRPGDDRPSTHRWRSVG